MGDEQPKKKRSVKPKVEAVNAEIEEVNNLIDEALTLKIREAQRHIDDNRLRETIVAVLQEFLSSFAVIGFNLNGDPISLLYAKSFLEGEALQSFITKFYIAYKRKYGTDIMEDE